MVLKEWEVEALEEMREGKLAKIYSMKSSSFSLKTKKKKIKMKVKRDYVILPWLRSQRQTQIQ